MQKAARKKPSKVRIEALYLRKFKDYSQAIFHENFSLHSTFSNSLLSIYLQRLTNYSIASPQYKIFQRKICRPHYYHVCFSASSTSSGRLCDDHKHFYFLIQHAFMSLVLSTAPQYGRKMNELLHSFGCFSAMGITNILAMLENPCSPCA